MKKLPLVALSLIGYVAYTWYQESRYFAVVNPDGSSTRYGSISVELDSALHAGGVPVLVERGEIVHTYQKQRFMEGWLLDGCPLNVILSQEWLPGQSEALTQAGIQPTCPVV